MPTLWNADEGWSVPLLRQYGDSFKPMEATASADDFSDPGVVAVTKMILTRWPACKMPLPCKKYSSGRCKHHHPEDLPIAEYLIGSLDGHGYLSASVEEVACILRVDLERVQRVLGQLQMQEPVGSGRVISARMPLNSTPLVPRARQAQPPWPSSLSLSISPGLATPFQWKLPARCMSPSSMCHGLLYPHQPRPLNPAHAYTLLHQFFGRPRAYDAGAPGCGDSTQRGGF